MQIMTANENEQRAMPGWRPIFVALAVLATLVVSLLFLGAASARPASDPIALLLAPEAAERPPAEATAAGAAKTKTEGGKVPCSAPQPTATATPVCTLQFADVPPSSPFHTFIRELACRGILSGYTCGGPGEGCNPDDSPYFRPGKSITRGQASKILANAADLNDPAPPAAPAGPDAPVSRQTFEDVPVSQPFWLWIERLAGHGAIGGYPCGGPGEPCVPPANRPYFRPGGNITRGQAAKIAALAANITDPVEAGQQTFADVGPNQPFWIWIEQIARRGVMGGYPCGGPDEPCGTQDHPPYFRPGNNITRGQASKIVANIFYPNGHPAVPCGPSGGELLGGGNPSQASNTASDGVNVNTATGNFSHNAIDFNIPGRGPALLFSRTYNSLAASVPGPVGYGWTHSYNFWIESPINPVVHQGNGSTAPFWGTGPNYEHDPRLLAELVRNDDGTYILTYTQGQMRFFFNAQGNLTEIRNRNNYATTLAYNGSDQLTRVTDTAGRQLLFTYDDGRVSRVDDTAGSRSVTYAYEAGNLITATDVAGNATHFIYDGDHHMVGWTDPNGGTLNNSYNAAGQVTSQVAPISRVYDFAYVTTGNHTVTTVTNPLGVVTVYTYTCNRLTTWVKDAHGANPATSTYTYGAGYVSGLAAATDANGQTWTRTWDGRGNLLIDVNPLGETTTRAYNATNDVLSYQRPDGLLVSYTYEGGGNVLSASQPLTETGQIVTTRYGYDPAHPGDVISMTDPLSNTWRTAYDTYGYVSSSTNPLGETTAYTSDALGRQLSVISPRGNTATTTYTVQGDPLTKTDFGGKMTTFTYDALRHRLTLRDAKNQTTSYAYNLAGSITSVTRPDGTHTDTDYDCAGQAVAQANGLGQITTTEYDAFGRVIRWTDALNRVTQFAYDDGGLLTTEIDAQDRVTQYDYDDGGRLRTINYNDGAPNVTFDYDALGRRKSMTDGTGTTIYGYDSLGRLTSVQQGAQTVSYTYDLAGNQTSLTVPGLGTVTHTYDEARRMTSLSDPFSHTTQFQYNPDGELTARILPNGTRTDMDHDADGDIISITHSLAGTPFLALTYTRDAVGKLATANEPGAGTNSFTYDGLDRLTGDALAGGEPVNRAWGYDAAYQITDTSILSTGEPVTTTHGYNAGNEMVSVTEWQSGTLTRDRAFSYNASGNRTGQTGLGGPAITYGYNQANVLTSYNDSTTTTTYSYDGTGLRRSKTQGANTQTFLWDVSGTLPLLLADGKARYIYGPDGQPLAEVISGTNALYYYHADQLGSVRALTNAAGAVANTASYDPYGVPLTSTGSVANPFGYAGEYHDSESALVYLRARYYDPGTQQFLTRDPLSTPATSCGGAACSSPGCAGLGAQPRSCCSQRLFTSQWGTPYAYVSGDPLNAIDPTGLWPAWKHALCVGTVAWCVAQTIGCVASIPLAVSICGAYCTATTIKEKGGKACLDCIQTAYGLTTTICKNAWNCWVSAQKWGCP